jgi:hypothetical protein
MGIILCMFLAVTGIFAVPQAQKVEKESIAIRVLKVERIKDERDGNLWYVIKLIFRDSNNRLYHARSQCVSILNVDLSCGNLTVPRAGLPYTVLNYGSVFIQFGADRMTYEIESEEVSDCK